MNDNFGRTLALFAVIVALAGNATVYITKSQVIEGNCNQIQSLKAQNRADAKQAFAAAKRTRKEFPQTLKLLKIKKTPLLERRSKDNFMKAKEAYDRKMLINAERECDKGPF